MNYQYKSSGIKKIIVKLFLYKAYKFNKKLFIFFAAFAGITVICNLAGDEITPFYVWGMYSEKEVTPSGYELFRITVNDKVVDYSTGYFPSNRFFLQSPLSYYTLMKKGGDPTEIFLKNKLKNKFLMIQPYASRVLNSTKEFNEFPLWYKRYLQQTTGETIQSFKVEVLNTSFNTNNVITINDAYTLIDGR